MNDLTPASAPSTSGPRLAGNALLFVLLAFVARAVIIDVPALASGPGFWLLLGACALLLTLALRAALIWLSQLRGRDRHGEGLLNACIVIGALTVSSAALELAMGVLSDSDAPLAGKPLHAQIEVPAQAATAQSRIIRAGQAEITLPVELVQRLAQSQSLWAMPAEWVARPTQTPGASTSTQWHGVPHITDADGFRRLNGPFPPPQPDRFRIVVLGDSMTYGFGVAADWAYPALLQRILDRTHRIEVINLGVPGAQSTDIARMMARMVPELRPNLVLYGMCLNDFLPSGEQETAHAVGIPLPNWIRLLGVERTRLGRLLDDAYRNLLVTLGISRDFWDDVLKDFSAYQNRFQSDMKDLRRIGDAAGLPPVTAIVLDQLPSLGSRGHRIATIAEAAFRTAGLNIVPTEAFYRAQNGRPLFVSRWELHPNEEAHAIFATMLADHLLARADLAAFRRTP